MRQNPPVVGDRGADARNRLTRTGPRVGFSRSHKSAGFTPRSRLTLAGVGRLLSVARRTYGRRVRSGPNQSQADFMPASLPGTRLPRASPVFPVSHIFVRPPITRSLTSTDSCEPL